MLKDNYVNPRIEGTKNRTGNASEGRVRFDWPTFIWLAPMMILGTVGSAMNFSFGALIVFVVFTVTTLCLGHSLGMHRRFIHRSFNCPRWLEMVFLHLGTLVGLAGPLGMLRTHDLRDWAQRQAHCHPFLCHDKPWYLDAYWQLFCRLELSDPPEIRIEADLENDRLIQLMDRTWRWQQVPWALLLYWLGGWSWVCWGVCSRVSVGVLGHWWIGYIAHNSGHRSWHVEGAAVQGHNVKWASLLTMGESWHNNHHAFPYSAKLGLFKGQWDPGWQVLLILQRLGMVSDLIVPNCDDLRPELKRIS